MATTTTAAGTLENVPYVRRVRFTTTNTPAPNSHIIAELGSGTVLRGLLRSTDKQARSFNVEDPESLQATWSGLGVPAGSAEGA